MNVVLNKEALSTQATGNSIFSLNRILEIIPCSWIQNSFQPARLSMIWACLPLLLICHAHPCTHSTSTCGLLVIPQTHKASFYLRAFIFSVSVFLQDFSSSSFFDRSPHVCYSCLSSNVPSWRFLPQWHYPKGQHSLSTSHHPELSSS